MTMFFHGRRHRCLRLITTLFTLVVFTMAACLPVPLAFGETNPPPGGNYSVTYVIRDDWGTGATVDVTITNNNPAVLNGWTLAWNFPGNQKITNLWGGSFTQNGTAITVKNVDYTATIPGNGGKVTFGFNLSYSGSNTKPATFTLNGNGVPSNPTFTQVLAGNDISYIIRDDWGAGATIDLTITNNSSTAINGWTLAWTFPGNQQITNLWNGSYTQNGASVTVHNLDYNAVIPANGGKTTLGFSITYTNSNLRPTDIKLNGNSCLNSATSINYQGVSLNVPANAAPINSSITIIPLTTGQMKSIPADIPNITSGAAGYEITFNGANKFLKDVKVGLKYDQSKLPTGTPEGSAFIYYYDETAGGWRNLKRETQDIAGDVVTCSTNHFCQMFAGAMASPSDSPQSKGLNTTPANIQKVGPMAGIRFINPPTPNNYGSANLSYPIAVPEGLNNLAPKVVISYSSDSKSGNCGYGWNLGVDAITIDTKNGIPKYDGQDQLLLNGSKLVNVGNNVYRSRVEGSFAKIVKEGNGFVVYQTSGSRMYYGWDSGTRITEPNQPDHVFTWLITKFCDNFGNEINYSYANHQLAAIRYGYQNEYSIVFSWEDRSDKRSSYRSGFQLSDDQRLAEIFIKNNNTILKQYKLNYITGAFSKTLLDNIIEKNGVGSQELNRTSFQYDTDLSTCFSNTVIWPCNPLDRDYFSDQDLRYSTTDGSMDHTWLDLVDINGDGMPDWVGKKGNDNNFYIYYNTGQGFIADTDPDYSWVKLPFIITAPSLRPQCPFGVEDLRYSFTDGDDSRKQHTEIDFTDFNGDGLADRVAKQRDYNRFYVQVNNGNGFNYIPAITSTPLLNVTNRGSEDLRYNFIENDGNSIHTEIDFLDFNGDGVPDRVGKHRDDNFFRVQLNICKGFTATSNIPAPVLNCGFGTQDLRYTFIDGEDSKKHHTEIDFVDFNGDGLPDRVAKRRLDSQDDFSHSFFYIQYNSGSKFVGENIMVSPLVPFENRGAEDLRYTFVDNDGKKQHTEVDFVDINGDGLPDRVAKHRYDRNIMRVQFNTGRGFTDTMAINVSPLIPAGQSLLDDLDQNEDLRYAWCEGGRHTLIDFADINGDGLPDRIVKTSKNNNFYIQFNQMGGKNLLKKVVNTTGTEINLDYKRVYLDPNRDTTHNYAQKLVLDTITTGKPLLNIRTTIGYENGIYDRAEREFRGFQKMTISTVDFVKLVYNIVETTYRVADKTGEKDPYGANDCYDPYLKGQVDTITKKTTINNLVVTQSKEKYEYEKVDILSGNSMVKFVYPAQKRVWRYKNEIGDNRFLGVDQVNGDLTSSTAYLFNTTSGLVSQTTEILYGDPHHTRDDVKTVTKYAVNETNWLCMAYQTETTDLPTGGRIALKTSLYDDMSVGNISQGFLTGTTVWNNNGNDLTTNYNYDVYGNVHQITDSNGSNQIMSTNLFPGAAINKEVITESPVTGTTTTVRYDMYGRTKEKVNGYGEKSIYTYDDYGRVTSLQEEIKGNILTTMILSYDKVVSGGQTYYMVQAEHLNDPSNNGYLIMQYFKDIEGREIQTKALAVVDGIKCWVVSGKPEFDTMGRITKTGASFVAPFYNDKSLVPLQMVEPASVYNYDSLGRNLTTILPTGATIENSYDALIDNGVYQRILYKTTTRAKDAAGNVLQEKSDFTNIAGQVVRTVKLKENGEQVVTGYEDDLHGYSTASEGTVGKGEKQKDSLGRSMWLRTPDAGKVAYTYNDKGLVATMTEEGRNETDLTRRVTQYSYDNVTNQIIKVDHEGTDEDLTLVYYSSTEPNLYARSNIKSISKGGNYNIQFNYGPLWKEEVKTIDGKTYTTRYEYDLQGRINKLTYPDGEVVVYAYNEGGLLLSITGNQVYVAEILYNEFGQRTYLRYGNGTVMTYSYDGQNRNLNQFTTYAKGGQELLRNNYSFDLLGNITSFSNSPNGSLKSEQTYSYDGFLNKLTGSTGQYIADGKTREYDTTFEYDDDSRILHKTVNGTIYDYSYISGTHAPASVTATTNGTVTDTVQFSYDDFGNMTQKLHSANPNQSQSYTYSQCSRLSSVTGSNLRLQFTYDQEGQRLKKVYGDGVATIKETVFVNGFYTVSAGQVDKHISDGRNIIATKAGNSASGIKYYHQNHIGSTELLTDSSGAKFQAYLYYPYGETWVAEDSQNGNGDITRMFTGQEYDRESGLYYYNARYYNPGLGMFISPDPMGDGFNHYAYCLNNPVNYSDPTGLWNIGFGLVFGWESSHGWNIGVGFALDFKDAGLGVNISGVYNFGDESFAGAAEGEISFDLGGVVGITIGAEFSYNNHSGYVANGKVGANIFGVGAEVGSNNAWTTGGDYSGSIFVKGYLGNTKANVGGGYEWGFGGNRTGWFAEAKVMGLTIRNTGDGWHVTSYKLTVGGGLKSGTAENYFYCSAVDEFKGAVEASMAPMTVLGMAYGVGCYLTSKMVKTGGEYIVADKTGISFVTSLELGGALTLGFARTYAYGGLGPDSIVLSPYTNTFVSFGKHETYHTTNQWQVYGIYFGISYLLHGAGSPSNPWDHEADAHSIP